MNWGSVTEAVAVDSDLRTQLEQLPFESAPAECQDAELYLALRAFRFSMNWEPGTIYHSLVLRVKEWLLQPETIRRMIKGVSDPYSGMRRNCGQTILRLDLAARTEVALKLLSDSDWGVRQTMCQALYSNPDGACEGKLISLASGDRDPKVRAFAAQALAKCTPQAVIPVLLRILDEDHECDPTFQINSPSSFAAAALDELMDTNWVETRFPDGTATFPPGPRDIDRLREQAMLYLSRLQNS